MTGFNDFNLPPALKAALTRMKYTTPTPIQEQAIPIALEGKDILGSAQTGTGKTAAFGIPLMARLLQASRGSALVLTPTRELATQVMDILNQLGASAPSLKSALIIGGDSMPKQIQALRQRPRVIVGTPGRVNDHLARGTLMLHDTGFLVLDETDRMLDLGFGVQLEKIVRFLPKARQTLMFSATIPTNIEKLASAYLSNPQRISAGGEHSKPAANLVQHSLHVADSEKYNTLVKQLDERKGSIIVFVKTKFGAERLAVRLRRQNHSADAIHGDLQQRQRERVIDAFRDRKHRILVATDIAARGLDIPHIEHVINYDLPQCPEDYIHRIGRTARNGADGETICFISPEDGKKWQAIQRLLNPGAPIPRGPAGEGKTNPARKRRRRPASGSQHRGQRSAGQAAPAQH